MPTVAMVGAKAQGVELKAWHRPAIRAIDHYIQTLGEDDPERGKTRFLAALMLSTSDDQRVDQLLQMVEDPAYGEHTPGHLAVACGFRAGELLRIVRDMELLVAQARGIKIIGDNLAAVVSDVVDRSQRHYISCEACNETGKVWYQPKPPRAKKGEPPPELPPPIQVDCLACNGRGKIVAEADAVRQQMVLEISKLLPKAGGSSIAIQQNLGVGDGKGSGGGGSIGGGSIGGLFDRIIGATDAILKRSPASGGDSGSADLHDDDEDGAAESAAGIDQAIDAVLVSPADDPAAEPPTDPSTIEHG